MEQMSFQLLFGPCIENVVEEGDEIFLPAEPYSLMSEGKFNKVPSIIGFTSHEGMMLLRALNANPAIIEMLNNKEDSILPYTVTLKKNTPASKQLASKIRSYYFGDKPMSTETYPELTDMYSDAFFIHGIRKCAELQIQHLDVPLYMYQFSFDEDLECVMKLLGGKKVPGACHGSELPYLFRGFYTEEERLKPGTDHMKMINTMVKLWTNFAKTGNPTPNGEKDIGINWKSLLKSGRQTFIDITLAPSVKEDKERYKFWDVIQKQL